MAGYVFSIGKYHAQEIIRHCAKTGVYSTNMKPYTSHASIPFEGTIADYLSMKPGDNVYFFSNRMIYGIGGLISIDADCKYCNYPGSVHLHNFDYQDIRDGLLLDVGVGSVGNRWLCTFEPAPFFFAAGIDMDEVLAYRPTTFKMLRAFWKLSFIKLGDEENQSLKEILMLRNQSTLVHPHLGTFPFIPTTHQQIRQKLTPHHAIQINSLLSDCSSGDRITHEMAIEAATVDALMKGDDILGGAWDHVSHQVIASPFKAIDYMDKIDIFAYRFIEGTTIISKYLVIEIKSGTAGPDTVDQVMKYVDWVCREYTYGDYDMVEAMIIAYDFEEGTAQRLGQSALRNYARGSHPVLNKIWSSLRLIQYRYQGGRLVYRPSHTDV